jgi:hypothetical protein
VLLLLVMLIKLKLVLAILLVQLLLQMFLEYLLVDILDYSNTNKYTTVRTLAGFDNNGNGAVTSNSGLWHEYSRNYIYYYYARRWQLCRVFPIRSIRN